MSSRNGEIGDGEDQKTVASVTQALSNLTLPHSGASTNPLENNLTDEGAGGDTILTNSTDALLNDHEKESEEDQSAEPLKIPPEQRSDDYRTLIQYGLDERVSAKLDDIYNTGTVLMTIPPYCVPKFEISIEHSIFYAQENYVTAI